jgi:zinc protease
MTLKINGSVAKKVLSNGLTILVRSVHTVPKVSIQLWYQVGSKDELSGEKGIAHLIEHMIFKGTQKLSESDLDKITHKLSGYCNAFTSFDYTGYVFDFPSQHWKAAFPILADCMRNCVFDKDMLNGELKAVIQELKMYKDDYGSTLAEELLGAIFSDHPYHHPVIGYKQDLWSITQEAMLTFYHKHYIPNNATLVVVGDVDTNEVFAYAQEQFGALAAHPNYTRKTNFFSRDIVAKTVTLFRDVQQPLITCAFVVPGAQAGVDYALDALSWILAEGKSSRLYRRLVDEEQLATAVEPLHYDLFEHGVFFIYIHPVNQEAIGAILAIVRQELTSIMHGSITDAEIARAVKKIETDHLALFESNQRQASAIGEGYLTTGDENNIFNYLAYNTLNLKNEITQLVKNYFRPIVMHTGAVVPLREQDELFWKKIQRESDETDTKILSRKVRNSTVAKGNVVHSIQAQLPKPFSYPKASTLMLNNGLKVLYYHNPALPKIDLILDLKTKSYFDPAGKEGLCAFTSTLLLEGTKNHSATEFAQVVEGLGMSIHVAAGIISMGMLSADAQQGFSLLTEMVTQATFEQEAVEKIRQHQLSDIYDYWDNPGMFIDQLARKAVYGKHPYSLPVQGTLETVQKITHSDLLTYYKNTISPDGARLVITGDLSSIDLPALLNATIGCWRKIPVADLHFPSISPTTAHTVDYPINRDQITLGFAGLSVAVKNPAFDPLLLFDQIFSGSALGSMSSRLYELRQQSGLFYSIGGSLLTGADEQPGMAFITTMVSQDRLLEAEKAIKDTIDTAASTLKEQELDEAKNAIINSLPDSAESNMQIAGTLLLIDRLDLPTDYLDTRAEKLNVISLNMVKSVAEKLVSSTTMATLRIGRLS